MDLIRKRMQAEMSTDESSFTATITTGAVDRDDEVLLPSGMDASEFLTSPSVFLNHKTDELPIGKAVDLKRKRGGWSADVKLAERPESHEGEWLPDTVHALMKQGILNGVSVGLKPMQARPPTKKDRQTFGAKVRRVISKWKLLEFSVVGLPANQEALVTAVSKGLAPDWLLDEEPELVAVGGPPVLIDDSGWSPPKPVRHSDPLIPVTLKATAEPVRPAVTIQMPGGRPTPPQVIIPWAEDVQPRTDVGSLVTAAIEKKRGRVF